MGLFFTQSGAANRKRTPSKTIRISTAEQKLLNCSHCPLDKAELAHAKMRPTGANSPLLYFLGEAPGRIEDEEGEQFVGRSGELIRDRIPSRLQSKIRWNNTIRCRPPNNRDPSALEVACCRRLQEQDIEQSKPRAVVVFGGVPLAWALGDDRKISNWRGRRAPVRFGSHACWLFPIMHPAAVLHAERTDKKKAEAFLAAFERDLLRVLEQVEAGLPEPYLEAPERFQEGVECLSVYGADGLARIEERLGQIRDEEHGLDIETDRLRPYSKDARILSLAAGPYESVFSFGWEHSEARWSAAEKRRLHEIVEHYLLGSGTKWAHSAKFEQEWMHARFGPRILYETPWGDTLGQAHVLDERKGKALDDLTQLHFGFRVKSLSPIDVRNLASTPLDLVLPYNALDAKYCHALSMVQRERLEEEGLTHVYERLHSATPALVQMQAKGVIRDLEATKKLDKELTAREGQIAKQIAVERDVLRYLKTGAKFSPTSNQNLVSFFRDFLKVRHPVARDSGEGYSVDEEALSQIAHPVAALVLELRSASKIHGYITPLLEGGKYLHGDGMIHSSYSNYVTVSGRLASEDPNQQNYPRRKNKEIRRAIGCPPGYRFVALDYGQLEARIVAAISGDSVLIKEIKAGQDIHGDWTERVGGRFVPKLVKSERKKVRDSIKQYWTFAGFYGNTLEGIAFDLSREWQVDVTPRTLAPFFDDFWDRYAGVLRWQERLIASYWKTGYVETATGQRRREPMSKNEIINHPVQGTAGHLVIDAQTRISRVAYEEDLPDLNPIMNVHDDLSFYFPDEGLEDCIEAVAGFMCRTPFDFVTVPLMVEVSVGNNWCDKEEIGKFSTEDFE